MNGEEEKNSQTMALLICNLIIWGLVIGTLFCIFLIDKVEAKEYRILNNGTSGTGSWTTITDNTEYTNEPITLNTTGKTLFQFRDTFAFSGSNKYNIQLDFEFEVQGLANKNDVQVFANIYPEIFNGSTLQSTGSLCSISKTETSTSGTVLNYHYDKVKVVGTITCTGLTGNGYYPYFSFSARQTTSGSFIAGTSKIKFIRWQYTRNTSGEDANAIINANNQNTQNIMNNQNTNTQNIINNYTEQNDRLIETLTNWDSPTQPSTTTSDDAFNKESQIMGMLDQDITLQVPEIDTTSNNLIWEWVHRLLFTNLAVSGCVIALLTFGVIKLILGR